MVVTKEDLIKTRITLLKQMNTYIINLGDEEIWMDWITVGVPDEACEEDYQYIAENDKDWINICELFGQLVGCAETEL